MDKENCPHTNLTILNDARPKMRCRYCHLTIEAQELSDSYCPECYEATGYKKFDFDAVASTDANAIRYRCEDCGVLIEND